MFPKLLLSILLLSAYISAFSQNKITLSYDQAATQWDEALPIGNGKLGAMIYGGYENERLQLNDNTLWSGSPSEWNNSTARQIFPVIREAVLKDNCKEAHQFWKKMQGAYTEKYLPMANLLIDFKYPAGALQSYKRTLHLEKAISRINYKVGNTTYKRETFASYPDKVIVMHLYADKSNSISFGAYLNSDLQYTIEPEGKDVFILKGKAPAHVAHRESENSQILYNDKGMTFEVRIKVIVEDGTVRTDANRLYVDNANEVTLLISSATSFTTPFKIADKNPSLECSQTLKNAASKKYQQLLNSHLVDYTTLFNRVSFDIGDTKIQQLFQYGRYLLLASSRQGGQAANLQGLWNRNLQSCDYGLNLSTQMNYWLAESANLSECHEPLFDLIENLSINGKKTAQTNYGLNGWVSHSNTDLWGLSSPSGGFEWDTTNVAKTSAFSMSGAWLSEHLWEHYLYTGDKTFLKQKAYPILKGAAQFVLEWLTESNGYLVTAPSISPENEFISEKGFKASLSMASTMDMEIIRDLLNNCIEATKVLKTDATLRSQMEKTLKKLYPPKIGKSGALQEWYKDFTPADPKSPHLSHLFGLYPSSQISPFKTPELSVACQKSLTQDNSNSGASRAWKANLWARLGNGDNALTQLNQIKTSANFLNSNPYFSIDANLGITAAIIEMVVQSHNGEIYLLPALPKTWAKGSIKGIKLRGGFEIDMEWNDNQLVKAEIRSKLGGNCRVRSVIPIKIDGQNPKEKMNKNTYLYDFPTRINGVYEISR